MITLVPSILTSCNLVLSNRINGRGFKATSPNAKRGGHCFENAKFIAWQPNRKYVFAVQKRATGILHPVNWKQRESILQAKLITNSTDFSQASDNRT